MRNIYKTLLYLLFVLICFGCGMDKNLSGEKYNSKSRLTNISSENSLFDDILTMKSVRYAVIPIGIRTTTPVIILFLNFTKILLFFFNFVIDYGNLECKIINIFIIKIYVKQFIFKFKFIVL